MKTQAEPLTGKQIKELQGYIAPLTAFFRSVLFLLVLLPLGWLCYVIQRDFFSVGFPYWLISVLILGAFLYVRAGDWTGGWAFREKVRKDLQNGVCNYCFIEPIHVTQFEEQEDEGPAYLIETVDNHFVFLAGQYFNRYKSDGFPWEKFALLEAPFTRKFFGIQKLGESISVTAYRPPLEYNMLKRLGAFKSAYLILTPEELSVFNLTC